MTSTVANRVAALNMGADWSSLSTAPDGEIDDSDLAILCGGYVLPGLIVLLGITGTKVGVISSNGDHEIIDGVVGTPHKLHEYQVQLEGNTANTVLVKAGNETLRRIYLATPGTGFGVKYKKPLSTPAGSAITLNTSNNSTVNYMIRYSS